MQHKEFKWKSISTQHFNIFYYQDGNTLAHNTARHLETIHTDVTQKVGYLPYNKINILVYNSDSDLQQSNISLENNYSAGGETNLVKSRIEVAFNGNQLEYYQDLQTKFAGLLINIIMYGGNFRDMVESSYLIEFPEWFLSGCAEYIGHGNNEEMYNAVHDFAFKRNKNPDKLTGRQATLIGQSIFHYITEKHGQYAIANILSLTKSTRNEEQGIQASTSENYDYFMDGWLSFYKESYLFEQGKDTTQRLKKTSRQARITQFKASPDKSKVAYAVNRKGIYYVYYIDLETNQKKMLYYGGVKNINWSTDQDTPIIAWKSETELSLIKYKRGKPYLLTKDIDSRFKKEKKLFVTFDVILNFDFAPNGDDMVLSGVKEGQSDIYTYNTRTNVAKRITKDIFDDLDPHYNADGTAFVFSSNRLSDTLRSSYGRYHLLSSHYNVFEFDGNKVLTRLTDNSFAEQQAYYLNPNEWVFRSTDGTRNKLFKYNRNSAVAHQIKTPNRDIPSIYPLTDQQYLYVIRTKERDELHVGSLASLDPTGDYMIKQSMDTKALETEFSKDVLINQLLQIDPDERAYDSDPVQESNKREPNPSETSNVRISFPQDVTPQFGIDYVISTIQIDPIRNFGALFEVGTSDIFSDHRISANIYTSVNLRSSDMSFQYEYLKRNLDFRLKVKRNSYLRSSNTANLTQRQTLTEILPSISKPFSPVARLEFTPGLARTTFIDFFPSAQAPDYQTYARLNLAFIYDNTTEKAINQLQGFRMKAQVEKLSSLLGDTPGYNKFTIDIRNYQPILRNMVFATRASFGRFGGNLPRFFVLGGVDNWLLQQYANNDEFDPFTFNRGLENPYLLFNEFTTNLRGFDYNQVNGNSSLLFNAELRIPIVKMLYSGPVSSSFFRNLQLNLFYDVGTAWNGSQPFNKDNSINTRNVGGNGNPFSATVINYQNPFLSAYGFGLRSMMFGYYVKMDLGFGIRNFVPQRPKFQISLGYDF